MLTLALCACNGTTRGEVGDPCLTTFDCADPLVCFETRARGPECMTPCAEDERLCEDGSVCLAAASGQRVCYIGGDVPPGEACEDSGDCEPGAVCVADDAGARCRPACDTRRPSCLEGLVCTELEAPRGFCGAAAAE